MLVKHTELEMLFSLTLLFTLKISQIWCGCICALSYKSLEENTHISAAVEDNKKRAWIASL